MFFPLYYFLSSPHLFLLSFFSQISHLHLGTECRQTAALTHDVHPGPQATEVPGSLQEQGQSKAWHSSAGSRRVLGQEGTWEIMSLRRSGLCYLQGQECGISEQKRVRPTAESTLHADSADATHLQTYITIQNCGISCQSS